MAAARRHKENLVQAAAQLFRKQGYSATGLNEILKTSGAPKGSLYHYFPEGKESLAAAAVKHAGSAGSRTLRDLKAQTTSPTDFIIAYCGLLSGWLEDSDFTSGCPIATTVLETSPQSTAIQRAGAAVFEDWADIITQIYCEAGCNENEAAGYAVLCIASLEGALIVARATLSVKPITTIRDHLVAQMAARETGS